jgi:hypothetical protein
MLKPKNESERPFDGPVSGFIHARFEKNELEDSIRASCSAAAQKSAPM